MKNDLKNLFAAIPTKLDKELVDVLQQNEHIRIERIVSKGHTSPETGWYDQAQNEWVMLLQGEAIITFENREVTLSEGDYLDIPAHIKHKVSWTIPDKETIWLAVFYS